MFLSKSSCSTSFFSLSIVLKVFLAAIVSAFRCVTKTRLKASDTISSWNELYTLPCFVLWFLAYSYIQAVMLARNLGINSFLDHIFLTSVGVFRIMHIFSNRCKSFRQFLSRCSLTIVLAHMRIQPFNCHHHSDYSYCYWLRWVCWRQREQVSSVPHVHQITTRRITPCLQQTVIGMEVHRVYTWWSSSYEALTLRFHHYPLGIVTIVYCIVNKAVNPFCFCPSKSLKFRPAISWIFFLVSVPIYS